MDEQERGIDKLHKRIKSHGMGSLTDAERSMLAINWLFTEGYNGGLHQFFFNDSGQLAIWALRGLETVGAIGTADILRRAIALFPGGVVPTDQEERRTVMLEFSDRICEKIDGLTSEFFGSEEDVADLVTEYVNGNRGLFRDLCD